MSSLLPILAASSPASNLLRPAVTVEIAFNASYNTAAASRVWTDVTAYVLIVEGIGITHGRGDELSQADPNTLRLTLKNSDGRFTPGLSTSPYYPNVKIGRPIRVSVMTASGHTSVRFVGYIDEWPLEWPAVVDTFATSSISASSRTARLGLSVELKSIIEEEILLDDPAAYYTLGEAASATTASDTSGNAAPALAQYGTGTSVVFGNATGPGTDSLTAATFTAQGKNLRVVQPSALASITTTVTLECFVNTTHDAFSTCRARLEGGDSGTPGSPMALDVGVDGARKGYAQLRTNLVNIFVSGLGPLLDDGATHHVAATFSGTTLTLYVDGTSVGTASDAAAALPTFLAVDVGFSSASGTPNTATFAHAAAFASALGSTRIAAHANAGLNGFAGETPAARLTRYASYAGIPTAELSFETGMVPDLAHIDTTGVTALEMMRKVETTEEGVLFDARDGTPTFHARNHRYSAASAFTLDASAGQVEASYAPKLDRSAMRNDVTATSTDGRITGRAVNQTSIDTYGVARTSLDVATTNAEEPFQHASWLVGQYGEPQTRAPQLGVEIAHLPQALQASILNATVGTRFTVTGLPSQSDATSKDFVVEGYTETIGPETHRIEFNVSPAAPWDVWTVEDPVLGQYDAYPIAL